ncbi:MAG: DUF4340 domain-containing protein [Bacteroidales bacterium]|nr:DUF4340 domain-containing protein [Bacteroidales bacterium]MDY6393593.1 DUF4340 domain-containing protein [Bacteroidales bacterium]
MNIKEIYNKIRPKNRKQKNLYGLIAIVLLGLIVSVVWLANSKTTTIKQNYHIENVDSIVKITLKDKLGRNIVLDRKQDSLWVVNKDYECNQSTMQGFLETFANMRIREDVPKAAVNNIVKSLASNGVEVSIYTEDYLIDFWFIHLFKRIHLDRTFFVGYETQDRLGTYMLKKGDKVPRIVYIPEFRGYLSSRFNTDPDAWKSHNIFRYKQSEIQQLTIDIPNQKSQSFSLKNNGKGFDFLDFNGQQINNFDTAKVVALLSSFVNMNYESVANNINKAQKDTIFTHTPLYVITINDKKGKKETMTIYLKPGEDEVEIEDPRQGFFVAMSDINRCYALTSKTKDTLVMQYFTLDNVLQPASYFIHR